MIIVGLISSYCEGPLVQGAIRSAYDACDTVIVFDGPAGETVEGPSSDFGNWPSVVVKEGVWISDADKRTAMVEWAVDRLRGPIWGVWIDGDEILMCGENLRDYLQRIEWGDEEFLDGGIVHPMPGYKFPIRIVEFDGSVALCHGKVIRLDLVEEYHVSSYGVSFSFAPGVVMSLGNEPIWKPAVIDDQGRVIEHQDPYTPLHRPPLAGEPHLLHRSSLRHPARARTRMHDAEARSFEEMLKAQGM